MSLQLYQELLQTTYDRYLSAKGGPMALTFEVMRNSRQFGEMLMKHKLTVQGGPKCIFHAVLEHGGNSGFTSAWATREITQQNFTTKGELGWSIFEWSETGTARADPKPLAAPAR